MSKIPEKQPSPVPPARDPIGIAWNGPNIWRIMNIAPPVPPGKPNRVSKPAFDSSTSAGCYTRPNGEFVIDSRYLRTRLRDVRKK